MTTMSPGTTAVAEPVREGYGSMKKILVAIGMALMMLVFAADPALAATATVNNYCSDPVYAPNGTNKAVRMTDGTSGFTRDIACGHGMGNVSYIIALYPTHIVWDSGYSECRAAGVKTASRTTYARVWTTSSCFV